MCFSWCRRRESRGEPLLPPAEGVFLLTLEPERSYDEYAGTCRICWDPIDETVDAQSPRHAFDHENEVYVPLCDCTTMPYHVGCLWEQMSAWSNRHDWDRTCDVCRTRWRFLAKPPGTEELALHWWVHWNEERSVFQVRVRDEDGVFTDEVLEGVEIWVGPDTSATPTGPLIPLADAYTTVELHLPEPYTGCHEIYFEGRVGRRVPWAVVYSLFFSSGGT